METSPSSAPCISEDVKQRTVDPEGAVQFSNGLSILRSAERHNKRSRQPSTVPRPGHFDAQEMPMGKFFSSRTTRYNAMIWWLHILSIRRFPANLHTQPIRWGKNTKTPRTQSPLLCYIGFVSAACISSSTHTKACSVLPPAVAVPSDPCPRTERPLRCCAPTGLARACRARTTLAATGPTHRPTCVSRSGKKKDGHAAAGQSGAGTMDTSYYNNGGYTCILGMAAQRQHNTGTYY